MDKIELQIHKIVVGRRLLDADAYLWEFTEIDDLISFLKELKSKGATSIEWGASNDYDGDVESITIIGFYQHKETIAEAEQRIKEDLLILSEQEKKIVERDRKEYERLKKMFG